MSILFDSTVRRNPGSLTSPSAFGSGVSILDHTPTPLPEILRTYYSHPGRTSKTNPVRPYTSIDESWNLGWTMGREWDGNYDTFPMPSRFQSPKHRQAWMDGFDAANGTAD